MRPVFLSTVRVSIAALLLANGCERNATSNARFYEGTVVDDDLAGIWILDTNDVPTLRDIGYVKFTNRLDHVLLLNPNGTCAYRGFDDYFTRARSPNLNETAEHDSFLGEGVSLWSDGVPNGKAWYKWTPLASNMISGPYEQTNAVGVAGGHLEKNRWTQWKLQDGRAVAKLFEGDDGSRYRYRIRLCRLITGDNKTLCDLDTFFLLGKDAQGYFLWKPVHDNTDYIPLLRKMIRFRKLRPALNEVQDTGDHGR